MNKAVAGVVAFGATLAASTGALAHPGVHHLNGVGHALVGSDEWLTTAAVALWALAQVALVVGLLKKRRRS